MILTGKNLSTWRKTCPSATLPNTNHMEWPRIKPAPFWWMASDVTAQAMAQTLKTKINPHYQQSISSSLRAWQNTSSIRGNESDKDYIILPMLQHQTLARLCTKSLIQRRALHLRHAFWWACQFAILVAEIIIKNILHTQCHVKNNTQNGRKILHGRCSAVQK
jgi:hypothetical protein